MVYNLKQKVQSHWLKAKFIKDYKKLALQSSKYLNFLKQADKNDELKCRLWCVEVYDVLNNNDLNKVIKELYNLSNQSSYKVEVDYKKRLLKLQYARVEIGYTSVSNVAQVTFLQDKYIREI